MQNVDKYDPNVLHKYTINVKCLAQMNLSDEKFNR